MPFEGESLSLWNISIFTVVFENIMLELVIQSKLLYFLICTEKFLFNIVKASIAIEPLGIT